MFSDFIVGEHCAFRYGFDDIVRRKRIFLSRYSDLCGALYTFYITVYAIVNVVKYRKYNSPVMLTAKIIALSAALVSMLSLETAMLSEFGAEMPEIQKQILIAATGGGVSVAVVIMSCLMIRRSAKEIKTIRSTEN